MLNAVVRVNIGKIERIFPIVPVEHVRCIVRDKEAECGREVVCLVYERRQFLKLDVASRARQDTCRIISVAFRYCAPVTN